ncbi:Sulfate permease [hydrothermal vent metagenome]|uniref:Sulfate permease n=1 Tax=hydrothermal vent metagenome TaxID=652676 RepID=A0A3B0TX26_9ZZZZ
MNAGAAAPKFLPKIITTLSDGYKIGDFSRDALAGLSVALVALPLALAIAIASGAPPVAGLVTAIVAGFLVSAFGGSRVQIGGPTGAFIVVVASVIHSYGYSGLVSATFMAGIILVIAGLLHAGSLIRYVPEPVISGFTFGIALIIATSQLAAFSGVHPEAGPPEFINTITSLWVVRGTVNLEALAIGGLTMALIIIFRRLLPRFPGLVIAVAITSAIVGLAGLDVDTIGSRFGAIANVLPTPSLPDLSFARMVELFPSALIIAFLAGVESLLSAIVADRMSGNAHRAHTEVLAQGIANLGSAFFAGLPATGAIARTATNVRSGGKTPVAGMAHAAFLALFMLLLGPLIAYLAMPALAAILLLTAWSMAEPNRLMQRLQVRPEDTVLYILTFVLTLLVGLSIAIGVGVAIGLALRLRRRMVGEPKEWHPRDV